MNSEVEEFISRLRTLTPETASSPVADLYDIVAPIKASPDAPKVFEAIFQFFETHPDADHGLPGPLVHLMERHRGHYEHLLSLSVRRAPMPTTLHMVNRLLNSNLPPEERQLWLGVLESVRQNTSAPSYIREEAEHFISIQNERG